MSKKSLSLSVIACILICVFIAGCGRPVLFSECRDSVITVDGKYTDWGNARTYYVEKEKVILNLLNDKDYLYICIVTRNIDIEARLMDSGLCLWFDPSGKKSRNFGVRFPIGMMTMGMPMEEEDKAPREWRGEGDRAYEREGEEDRGAGFEKKLEILEGLQYKLQLVKGPFDKKKAPDSPSKDKPEELSILQRKQKLAAEIRQHNAEVEKRNKEWAEQQTSEMFERELEGYKKQEAYHIGVLLVALGIQKRRWTINLFSTIVFLMVGMLMI